MARYETQVLKGSGGHLPRSLRGIPLKFGTVSGLVQAWATLGELPWVAVGYCCQNRHGRRAPEIRNARLDARLQRETGLKKKYFFFHVARERGLG